jgi:hypothetical protein
MLVHGLIAAGAIASLVKRRIFQTVPSSLVLDKSHAMQDVKAPIADRPPGIHVSGWTPTLR